MTVNFENNWQDHIDGDIKMFLGRLGEQISANAKVLCPDDTGRLSHSIDHEVSGHTLRVGTNVDYALYVELGTKPHVIRPKTKKALYWEGAGHPVPEVHHPGTRAQPYLRPALYKARG